MEGGREGGKEGLGYFVSVDMRGKVGKSGEVEGCERLVNEGQNK
jgi:hypothetical protein